MSQLRHCPVCGASLPENRLGGICPACAWKSLWGGDEEAGTEPPAPGSGLLMRVAGHEVISEIARGGMGIVYRARQLEPRREVALKMLQPQQLGSKEMRERFHLEARAVASLAPPAILPVYEVGDHDGLPFFSMKLAGGGSLAARRDEVRGQFRRIAELLAGLADAVQFAHARGILHRDLKPGNTLFDDSGRPYVSDFALAKFVTDFDGDSPALTRTINLLGTPQYLAPEIVSGTAPATTAADIYGLGAILYELLAGRPPFEADSITSLLKTIVEEEPKRFSRLDSTGRGRPQAASTVPPPHPRPLPP